MTRRVAAWALDAVCKTASLQLQRRLAKYGPRLPIKSVTGKRQGARDAGTRGQAWTRGGEAGDWDGAMMRKKSGLVGPRGVLGP
jgi:hypothetical protein